MPRYSQFVLAILLVTAPVGAAHAESWGVGDPLRWTSPDPQANADLALEFTPRVGALSLEGVRLSLSLGAETADDDRTSALAQMDDNADRLGVQGFVLGGALAIDQVVVSAQMAQRSHAFGDSETWQAAVSAGGVTTALSYTDGLGGGSGHRFALGTAIEAAPGVSVGADLALDENDTARSERDALGVLRFKLRF